jgi:hypothetical protein
LRIDPEIIVDVVKDKNIRSEPIFFKSDINKYNIVTEEKI